ncbi:hypothetical protein THIOM_003758, partial [Candidatus Thiomargarita nelsonii]
VQSFSFGNPRPKLKLWTPISPIIHGSVLTKEIEAQMQELYNRLSEKNRRLYAGIEALKLPYGSISYIARLFEA